MSAERRIRGKCDGCGKYPRLLKTIESGQRLCRTCLRRIRKPKLPDPNAPASDEQLAEARDLGLDIPAGVSNRYVLKLIGFARRQFEISDDLLTEDYDRLIHLQDDVMCYVADLWEQLTSTQPSEANVPWPEQQAFAARIVTKHPELAAAIHHVQWQRERRKSKLEQAYVAAHPNAGRLRWSTFKQPVAQDDTYQKIADTLKIRWKKYLPKRPSLLRRLFGGR